MLKARLFKRTVQVVSQLPPALLPNASTTFAIATKSPQLAGEIYKRIGVLSAPTRIGPSRRKLQSSLRDHLRDLVFLPPFSLRSYDVWTRLLTNDELVHSGYEKGSAVEEVVPLSHLARVEALGPWLDRALQHIEQDDVSTDVQARNVTLVSHWTTHACDAVTGELPSPQFLQGNLFSPLPVNTARKSDQMRFPLPGLAAVLFSQLTLGIWRASCPRCVVSQFSATSAW